MSIPHSHRPEITTVNTKKSYERILQSSMVTDIRSDVNEIRNSFNEVSQCQKNIFKLYVEYFALFFKKKSKKSFYYFVCLWIFMNYAAVASNGILNLTLMTLDQKKTMLTDMINLSAWKFFFWSIRKLIKYYWCHHV